jgi:NAD-dependent DNA ligase
MDKDVPAWLVTLVAVFGFLTAITFVSFLHFHADLAAANEERTELLRKISDLKAEKGALTSLRPQIEQQIALRQARIQAQETADADERRAVTTQLLPAHDRSVAAIDQVLETRTRQFTTLLANTERHRQELTQVQQQALTNERAAEDERRELRAKIEEQSQRLEGLKRGHRDEILVLEQEVKERLGRVQELLDRRDVKTEEMVSDGQVLQARVTDGFVVINRGVEQDIHRGMRFTIFNRRGGENMVKGEVEVIDVETSLAVARVTNEADSNDPIIPGDHIYNPVYNPDEVKIYVIKGDFRKFSQPELARFIEDAGGVVEPDITRRTHYLVAGENADFALKEANLNGVTILSEDKLLAKVRTIDHFRIRRGMTFAIAGTFDVVDLDVVRRFVKNNGGILTPKVEDGTDVLLAGEDAAEAITAARLHGATVINQHQLVHLMGSSAAPQ